MNRNACRSCGAAIIWAPVADTGTLMPLDVQPELEPAERLVAYNPETNLCRVLKRADLVDARRWMAHGVEIHRSHFATCTHTASWRKQVRR